MPNDRPVNRRGFFREGLRELLGNVIDKMQPLQEVARQFAALETPIPTTPEAAAPVEPAVQDAGAPQCLRPPGALPEQQYTDTCARCCECVRVCPVQAIQIDFTGERGGGAPFIDPDQKACVVCDGLLCMQGCPSGALLPVPRERIDIGTAEWCGDSCLRTNGHECTLCVEQCPIGPTAIRLEQTRITVLSEGCIGCGVCQLECPTAPKSIVVIPKSARPPMVPR